MRSFSILLLLLCTNFPTEAQIAFESKANIEIRTWGTDTLDRGFFILPDKEKFLLVGLTLQNKKGQLSLSTLDRNLKITGERVYNSKRYDFCFAGVRADEGHYILSGFTTQGISNRDAWIIKINSRLDTLWTKSFGGAKSDQVYETIATADGNFVSIGQTESWGSGGIDALIIKIDGNGHILWHKIFGGPKLDRTYSSIELDNGDLIVSGITNENYPGNSDILLLRLTRDGELVWQKTFGSPKGDIAHSLHKRPDNTFFTIGYTAERSDSLSDPLIMHFNEDGDLLGKYTIVTGEDVKLINGFLTADGNYIGTGFSRTTLKSQWDIILSEFNFSTGKMNIRKARITDKEECGYHLQPFDKEHVLIFGHTLSGNGDNLLVKWKLN
jgi:hypothetical protein